ncbi:NCS1 family nucleobase:cation symporter-1 [Acetobacter tropicalis]|uniref:NCS1 family nucleobase:cation symporter-1 n=1 Tax=Acetobacter TaxID=434 RepID=UPI001EDA62AB|nr:NCS1 family nucleobase:cation symporter-1 [Acetobacter senegalensis]MCG4254975.1 NCS1 family nucleobase:cation symporter-1 [Acetobacter senegalensis]
MSEPASFSHSRHVELNASLSNSALLPTTERTWSWFDYLSFWMSDVHSVGTYVTLGNLFASDLPGMAVAIGLLVGILMVQILCNLVAVPSQQTGAPFPVICRASFGVKGALIPAFVRGVIAVCWYGIQTWLASNALVVLILKCAPALSPWADIGQHSLAGLSALGWLAFLALWLLQAAVFWRGIESIKHFTEWAGPLIYVVMLALDLYLLQRVGFIHGLHAIRQSLSFTSVETSSRGAFSAFIMTITLTISYFSAPMLNFGDFARYAKNTKDIRRGNFWGLPVNFLAFTALTLSTIALTVPAFGVRITDPVETVSKTDNVTVIIIAILAFMIATAGINVVVNFVSASFDFSNLAPEKISWRAAGLLAAFLSVFITPWNLYNSPAAMHFTLDFLASLIGPFYGIIIADYFIVSDRSISVPDLYSLSPKGLYWYENGINRSTVLTLCLSASLANASGLLPILADFPGISWFIGCVAATLLYPWLSSENPETTQKAKYRS